MPFENLQSHFGTATDDLRLRGTRTKTEYFQMSAYPYDKCEGPRSNPCPCCVPLVTLVSFLVVTLASNSARFWGLLVIWGFLVSYARAGTLSANSCCRELMSSAESARFGIV